VRLLSHPDEQTEDLSGEVVHADDMIQARHHSHIEFDSSLVNQPLGIFNALFHQLPANIHYHVVGTDQWGQVMLQEILQQKVNSEGLSFHFFSVYHYTGIHHSLADLNINHAHEQDAIDSLDSPKLDGEPRNRIGDADIEVSLGMQVHHVEPRGRSLGPGLNDDSGFRAIILIVYIDNQAAKLSIEDEVITTISDGSLNEMYCLIDFIFSHVSSSLSGFR